MDNLFWVSGHLGWGVFTLVIFTALWIFLSDLVWRVKNVRIGRLVPAMSAGWVIGVCLIFLLFYLV